MHGIRSALAALLLAAGATGCATVKGAETVCPEFRDLRCLSGTDCVPDRARGCLVCRCGEPGAPPPMPPGVPPERK